MTRLEKIAGHANDIASGLAKAMLPCKLPPPAEQRRPLPEAITPRLPPKKIATNGDGGSLTPTMAALLAAVAQFPSGCTRGRAAVFSGRSIKSSSFQAAFPALEQAGLIEKRGDKYVATDEGNATAGVGVLPSGPELIPHWMAKLLPSERNVLKAVLDAYPGRVTRDEVARATGQSIKSSSFQASFPALRDLELIEGHSDFRANDIFFEKS